jgi:Zn-finger nucleic acid-binding protein
VRCPKCEAETLEIARSTPGSTQPWRCRQCHGLWLDQRELPALLREAPEVPAGAGEVPRLDGRGGICPSGHGILLRARVELEEDSFSLERCPHCLGIWFDAGEWQRLASAELLTRLPEFWSSAWQKQQRRERDQRSHLDWAREAFGEDLFTQLQQTAAALRDHPRRSEAIAFLTRESDPAEGSSGG